MNQLPFGNELQNMLGGAFGSAGTVTHNAMMKSNATLVCPAAIAAATRASR